MFKMRENYPIAIDIGERHVFATQLQETRRGIKVRDLFHQQLHYSQPDSDEGDEALVQACRAVAGHSAFKGKKAAILLPSRHINSFPLTFEVGRSESVEDAIVRECRKLISFPLEEAVIDYPSIVEEPADEKRRFRASIVAAHRDQVNRHIRLVKRAGLRVEAVDFDLLALLRLHRYLFSLKEDPIIFCNIGYQRSLMAIVTHNRILAQRNTHWGTQGLLSRLETNFEFSGKSDQAAAMLSKYGLRYERFLASAAGQPEKKKEASGDDQGIFRTVFQILTPHLDVLIHEFYQTIGYVRSELPSARFDELFLYGQAGAINSLAPYLESRINIPVTCINPMLKLTLSDSAALADASKGAPFALALGLAIRKVTWL